MMIGVRQDLFRNGTSQFMLLE